jgi:hypothetical protein
MTEISAKVVGDSMTREFNERFISFEVTFNRFILAELNTHRALAKNSASSRAIPFNKMIESVMTNPFIPIAWQKDHVGMQGTEYIQDEFAIQRRIDQWLWARDLAVLAAQKLHSPLELFDDYQEPYLNEHSEPVTKQICNRILEPYMWHTVLIGGTEWDNFFNLRSPKYNTPVNQEFCKSWKDLKENHNKSFVNQFLNDTNINKLQHNKGAADIHIMALSEAMWDAKNQSLPNILEPGDWHIPYSHLNSVNDTIENKVKAGVGKAARVSYTVVGHDKKDKISTLINIHDKLVSANPIHASPLDQLGRAMTNTERENYTVTKHNYDLEEQYYVGSIVNYGVCKHLKGFIPYREIFERNLKI